MEFRTFDGPIDLAAALAAFTADALRARIARDGVASVALSGGRTPARFMEALADEDVDWSKVVVTLVDERWVDEQSDRSNARLVKLHLMQGAAAAARFVPLYAGAVTPELGLPLVEAALADVPLPLACAVLGMGDDGHTASFFPGGDRLAEAIDPETSAIVIPMRAEGAGEPRITLTLPVILSADAIALHIEKQGKRAVFDAAMAGDDALALPIRSVLKAPDAPLTVFWCA